MYDESQNIFRHKDTSAILYDKSSSYKYFYITRLFGRTIKQYFSCENLAQNFI